MKTAKQNSAHFDNKAPATPDAQPPSQVELLESEISRLRMELRATQANSLRTIGILRQQIADLSTDLSRFALEQSKMLEESLKRGVPSNP